MLGIRPCSSLMSMWYWMNKIYSLQKSSPRPIEVWHIQFGTLVLSSPSVTVPGQDREISVSMSSRWQFYVKIDRLQGHYWHLKFIARPCLPFCRTPPMILWFLSMRFCVLAACNRISKVWKTCLIMGYSSHHHLKWTLK